MKNSIWLSILKFIVIFSSLSFFSITAQAWHAHGGYYHHGYNNYGVGFGRSGVYVGAPRGVYYGAGCSYVQRCYINGCVSERVCY